MHERLLSQLDSYADAEQCYSSPEGCPGFAAAAGTKLSHHSPITAAAFPATLMQSEVSIESKLKLIFREPIDPGVSGQGTEELNSYN